MCTWQSRLALWLLWAGSVFLSGCGQGGDRPPLGYVTGTVTMDGAPLEGVIVTFKPDEGRAGVAVTDAQGHYDLEYRYRVKGAKIGPNTVSFSWPTGVAGSHAISSRYADKSEIKHEIKAGRNKFDFALESAAPTSKSQAPAQPD